MLNEMMNRIVSDQDLHARWLNTLSFLEYVGFRKIVKSQAAESLSLETLQHAQEEGRHALLLKKLALNTGGAAYDSYKPETLLRGEEAEGYFQTIDEGVHRLLGEWTYPAVTWLVEVRALEVYGAYRDALAARGLPSPLTSLLKEEERHLEEVERTLSDIPTEKRQAIRALEQKAFETYMRALEEELLAHA